MLKKLFIFLSDREIKGDRLQLVSAKLRHLFCLIEGYLRLAFLWDETFEQGRFSASCRCAVKYNKINFIYWVEQAPFELHSRQKLSDVKH